MSPANRASPGNLLKENLILAMRDHRNDIGKCIKTAWSYETDSWVDVTSVNFKSKKVHKVKIFGLQVILHKFSLKFSRPDRYFKVEVWLRLGLWLGLR